MRRTLLYLLILLVFLIPANSAFAASEPLDFSIAIDTIWVLLAAFLVFLMQAGFAMVEAGFTRAKNAGNIIMKNFMDFCCGSIGYWLVGFTIMFGVSTGGIFGLGSLALGGDWSHLGLGIPLYAFLIFQTVFAATAATIVSGAVAERIKFSAYLIYSIVITCLIYPVVGHWAWGGGWLSNLGFIDFAGSTVVHSVGGWAALAGALILGPRLGKFNEDGTINAIPGHSITLGALGVFILWFGWFGFNGGSTISGMNTDIALIIVNTNLAAAGAGILAMITTWVRYGKPDVSMTLNGGLAGLVAITAGCASVSPVGAALIGALGGILVVFSVEFVEKTMRVDDPVGAISVHGVCGAFGTLMVGIFAVGGGLAYGGGWSLLGIQALGILATACWVLPASLLLFVFAKKVTGLRVVREEEILGLDLYEHGMEAYSDFVPR